MILFFSIAIIRFNLYEKTCNFCTFDVRKRKRRFYLNWVFKIGTI